MMVGWLVRSVGKVCMVLIPSSYMLLVSLTIRACIADGGIEVREAIEYG